MNISGISNREEWEFTYLAVKVLDGARKQLQYRQSRVDFWESKKAEVMEEIRTKGLDVYEPEAEKLSGYVGTQNVMGSPQIKVDPALQLRLTEASNKIRENRQWVAEYDAWVQVLEGNKDASLRLKQGDWLFFFGRSL